MIAMLLALALAMAGQKWEEVTVDPVIDANRAIIQASQASAPTSREEIVYGKSRTYPTTLTALNEFFKI